MKHNIIIKNDGHVIFSFQLDQIEYVQLKEKIMASERILIPNKFGQLLSCYVSHIDEDYDLCRMDIKENVTYLDVIFDLKAFIIGAVYP